MFFKKKRSYRLPLGILLGTAVGLAGAVALVSSNKELRKTISKEFKKCCQSGRTVMNKNFFAVK